MVPKKEPAGGDAEKKKDKGAGNDIKKKGKSMAAVLAELAEDDLEDLPRTESQIAREEANDRANLRKARFKRHWPSITKVKIKTQPWYPPPPPRKPPPIEIEMPEVKTRRWVPPIMRRRRRRPKKARIPPEAMMQPLEIHKLQKIWHNFKLVEKNKMMVQGSIACNSKKYSSTTCGAQTGCIAVMARGLLDEKTPAELTRADVDELIERGDMYYKSCKHTLKCYKGNPNLQLSQILTSFFLHDNKYTFKLDEIDRGILAKHPDNLTADADLMKLMEKRTGGTYMMVLSIADTKHFLIWGHPPAPDSGSSCKTVCYIFDPHMLNEVGQAQKAHLGGCCGAYGGGAGAFVRYAGITSFVLDFLANYGDMNAANKARPKPAITLYNIEIVQKDPLIRLPNYSLELKALKHHCESEFVSRNVNALLDKKLNEGLYALASLSMTSVATSRANSKKKVKDFYQKEPKEIPPVLPMAAERGPANPTVEQIMSLRGANFFLNCPILEGHAYGRDDMIPLPKSETVLHSPVDAADKSFISQYRKLDPDKYILRATRHMASHRYQTFKWYTGIACCLAALAMLQRHRGRAWNEDTVDETLDAGYNIYRESMMIKGGPVRRLVLGEHKEYFKIRDREYRQKSRYITIWGKLISSNPKVFDLCKALDAFFKESDSGILQIPGELEVAIWNEGGKYYIYHPWPADNHGRQVSLYSGGKACVLYFTRLSSLCDHFLESCGEMKKKPFSISDVGVSERLKELPPAVNKMTPVAPNRWIVRGSFHEADARFPEENRGKQATPTSITALALAHVVDPAEWTTEDVDEALIRGDSLYQSTMENLEKMGISLESPKNSEENAEEEEESSSSGLAAADVLNRFKVSEYDCIETDVMDSTYNGSLNPEPGSDLPGLTTVLTSFFKENTHGVFTARGNSTGIWKHGGFYYFFDPHGCDENGLPSEEPRASACLMRVKGHCKDLAEVLLSNLPPGNDDTFNISPVSITATKLNPEIGAPETKLESKAFEWIRKGTHAIMMGPRGENSAIGKAYDKAGISKEDTAGRTLALPAAAAFVAASCTVPPPHMHMDHMFNFLDVAKEYFLNHYKRTGKRDIGVADLGEKFEMGANTFFLEFDEGIRLPLRLPDPEPAEGEGGGGDEVGMEEEEPETLKEMKELLFKMWYDPSKPTTVSLLVNDYYQLGIWMQAGGKVVAFDPAPTMPKGILTSHRIVKGDELRLQRIKDEMATEGGGDEEEEVGGEGEAVPEPEPEPVPPTSCPMLIVAASPGEFIDKLVFQGGLDKKQAIGPAWLYPTTVINELTVNVKDKKPGKETEGEDEGADAGEEEQTTPELDDSSLGANFNKLNKTSASVRGRVAQGEKYFMENPNRNNQDAANSVMGIVVDHIEPYEHWKSELIDSIVKYGDRLYTMSLKNAKTPPYLKATEITPEFHVTSFNVKLNVEGDVVTGDTKAGDSGGVLNLPKGIKKFFDDGNKYGVLCAKNYCVGIWKGTTENAYMMWEPHAVGPSGRTNPAGAATAILFSSTDELAETFKSNVESLGVDRPGNYNFSISSVKVEWEYSKSPGQVGPQAGVPDEGYEFKVLTAFVETARGRTILRGTRPLDLAKFTRDALLQSSAGAVVAAAMSKVRRPLLWTRRTVDEVMNVAGGLFNKSVSSLGYEFRPGEDVLLPLQVVKRFVLGVNYVRYDLQEVMSGKLENREPTALNLKSALERFFESHTHGILWSVPCAVAVWRAPGAPSYFMMEPHACGPTGLRIDAKDDGAACLMTFTSPKLMAFQYLQNTPATERLRYSFQLSAMSIEVAPIKRPGAVDAPLLTQSIGPTGVKLVPATSKVYVDGSKRRADESARKHPPGDPTCQDAQRATERADKDKEKLKGQRNASGWLVLADGSQFMSACHSMACKKFPYASRGNQALAVSVMAVAMSRVEDVCRWCSGTLDQILESGDQLYQDSYLHFKPPTKILAIEQILRKFYAPGNCVCRVVVYQARQKGALPNDLVDKVQEFFQEEKMGVFVAGRGEFAVALFKNPRGFYMFDPADRDRYGRAVAPPCRGKARACFSQYPNVNSLCEKLGPNIPPEPEKEEKKENVGGLLNRLVEDPLKTIADKVRFDVPSGFSIYGMCVTSLRRLNKHER